MKRNENGRSKRRPWLVQVRLPADRGCSVLDLRKILKGSGVEVDRAYVPKRVAPATFVGRGWATKRAVDKARRHSSQLSYGAWFFEEIRMVDLESGRKATQQQN